MSGGIAFVLAETSMEAWLNHDMVTASELVDDRDAALVRVLLLRHLHATGSTRALTLLGDLEQTLGRIVKVTPTGLQGHRHVEDILQTLSPQATLRMRQSA